MSMCWNIDPQERTKFSNLAEQLSNLLEQEAGYLTLRICHSLSWKTSGQAQKKGTGVKIPVEQSIDENEEESVEMGKEDTKK